MPSNKQLGAEALEIAQKLKIVVVTAGLNNAELVKLVADLKAKAKDAENDTQADNAESTDETTGDAEIEAIKAKAAEEAEVASKIEPFPYSVKSGKSITSKRGILGEGEEVKVEDLPGGQKTIDDLIERGYVEKG